MAVVATLAGVGDRVDAGQSVSSKPSAPDSVVLRQATGTIMVDRGNGYQAVRSGVELSQGDRVLVMERSGVIVATGERCAHRIGANSIVEIVAPTNSACGAHLQRMIGTMVAQAIGLDIDDPRSASPAGINDGGDGFGAIGAEQEQKLTPLELRSAGEKPAPSLERLDAASEDPPAEIVAQEPEEKLLPIDETGLVADSEEAALEAQPLAFDDEGSGSAGELFGVGATTLGAIAGGIGAVALLAGGGGGGGGGGGSPVGPPTPTPLSPQ